MSEEIERILSELEEAAEKIRRERRLGSRAEHGTVKGGGGEAAAAPPPMPEEAVKGVEEAAELERLLSRIVKVEGEEAGEAGAPLPSLPETRPSQAEEAGERAEAEKRAAERLAREAEKIIPQETAERVAEAAREAGLHAAMEQMARELAEKPEILEGLRAAAEKIAEEEGVKETAPTPVPATTMEQHLRELAERMGGQQKGRPGREEARRAMQELLQKLGGQPIPGEVAGGRGREAKQPGEAESGGPSQPAPTTPAQPQGQAGGEAGGAQEGGGERRPKTLEEFFKEMKRKVEEARAAAPPEKLPEQVPGMAHFYEIMFMAPSRDMFRKVTLYSPGEERRQAPSKVAAEAAGLAERVRRKINAVLHEYGIINLMQGRWITLDKKLAEAVVNAIAGIIKSFFANDTVRRALKEKGFTDRDIEKLAAIYMPRIIDVYIPIRQAIQLLEQARTRVEMELAQLRAQLREITEKRKRLEKERAIREKERILNTIARMIEKIMGGLGGAAEQKVPA